MNTRNKPILLLWLPVMVWAATFTYGTCLLFYLLNNGWNYREGYITEVSAAVVLINLVAVFFTLIMASVYPARYKEFIHRLLLLISNIPVAFVYITLVRLFAPF